MTLTARKCLSDDGLAERFKRERNSAQPVWLNAPYVGGLNSNILLWNDVLVVERWSEEEPIFGANSEAGIRFLNENQGPILAIGLSIGSNFDNLWMLDIQGDGSASVEFRGIKERAEVPPGSINFSTVLERLLQTSGERRKRHVSVHFRRKGQNVSIAKQFRDSDYVESLFRRVVADHRGELKRLFEGKFPLR